MPADLCPSLKRFAPKRRNREGSTLLLIAVSALSLVVVPFVGVCLSRGLAAQAVRQLEATSSDDVQRRCAQLANAVPFTADSCDLLSSARLIEHTYIASVALLVLVLLSFWLATLTVEKRRWVSVLGSSTLPAVCMLHGMLWLVLRAVSKKDRQRELAADQAAASVSSGEALLGAIVKLSLLEMQWSRFSAALEQFVAQGSTRVNFVQDFVARMNLFRRAVDSSRLTTALLASEQPHPFDTHPPLAVRAAAFHLAAAPIIKSSLADINDFHVPCRTMRELEEALTNVITKTMHKGSDLEVDRDPSVPFELAGPY